MDEFYQSEPKKVGGGLFKKVFGKKKNNKKDDFPYINTLKCNYTSAEVSKLSSLSSYNIVEGLKNVGFDVEQVGN